MSNRVTLSDGRVCPYQLPWDGRTRLRGSFKSPLAFDTETELIDESDPTHVPRLVLATASDGYRSVIIKPQQMISFLLIHEREHFVGQNMAFDFWVVENFLRNLGPPMTGPGLLPWWDIVDQGRMHDTILLDMLIRLAQAAGFESYAKQDTSLSRRNLDELARDYCNLRVDKEDPFRLRYGELIGKDWSEVTERGFWDYAIKDAIVTHLIYKKQIQVAESILEQVRRQHPKEFHANCHLTWGYLTESLQTRASIVLAGMQKKGMRVNPARAMEFENAIRQEMQEEVHKMWEAEPQVFKYRRPRLLQRARGNRLGRTPAVYEEVPQTPENIILTPKGGTPSMLNKQLEETLARIAKEEGLRPPLSDGKKKGISRSAKAWHAYRKRTPFLAAWVKTAKLAKMLSFFALFHDSEVLYPRYNVLMRTGRTSASRPNLQQMPRDGDFRSLFIPRAGYKIYTIDYSYIELRTLAVVCEKRYGWSQLADTIREGIDPHVYTAAMLLGMPIEDFLALKERDNGRFKSSRQSAKAVNFGVPGGLGAVKLAAYARASYGVDMGVEEAFTLRTKLIKEVYPELDLYLGDTSLQNMAWNFGVSQSTVKKAFGIEDEDPDWVWRMMRAVGKVIRGKPEKADGTPYKPRFVDRIWHGVNRLCSSSSRIPLGVKEQIKAHKGSKELERILCCGPALTLTGRVRGSATYTQMRNTPFQGLAADGAKQAMWDCMMAGLQVIGFIHDELLLELPEATAEQDAQRAEQLIIRGMEKVLDFKLPIACEGHVGDCWQKG